MKTDPVMKYTFPTMYPKTYYCPICQEELERVGEQTDRPEFSCSESCVVDRCYYNGTAKDVAVNMQTVHRYIEDTYSEEEHEILERYYNNTLSDPMLENLLNLVRKTDVSSFKQTSSGDRVLKYDDGYVRADKLLHYTFCFKDTDVFGVAKIPTDNARLVPPQEVEEFIGVN